MIPDFNNSGVLPPFMGTDPQASLGRSPYRTTLLIFAQKLCTTPERIKLARGLLQYRADLATVGLTQGIQWLDGSFCEDCEQNRKRPPGDIDVLTIFSRPKAVLANADWIKFLQANIKLFDKNYTKATYRCDAFGLDENGGRVIPQVAYWLSLFTHQRDTFMWKGLVEISLDTTADALALAHLDKTAAALASAAAAAVATPGPAIP